MRIQTEPAPRLAATRLSRRARGVAKISAICGLAWRSLWLLSMMLVVESCVVADPPEYRTPVQTRPVLNVYSAVPTATHALVVYASSKTPTSFTVQVRSEDAGEDMRALFFLDYQLAGHSKLISKPIPASTYDNTGRNIQYDWPPPAKTDFGCHFLSLIVAHRSSFLADNEDKLDPRFADDDAAIVTWTVNINPQPDLALENCPTTALPTVP